MMIGDGRYGVGASDGSPTESVGRQATVFRAIVATAAATDSHSSRDNRWSSAEGGITELM
jgi:hypothetical protein